MGESQLGLQGKNKLIHNERIKLRATMFNNLGAASAVGGGLLPALTHSEWTLWTGVESIAWGVAGAIFLHVLGVLTLRHLRE